MRHFLRSVYIWLLFSLVCAPVWATPTITAIDLNDFYADQTVTVAADGSSAVIAEDQSITPVLLDNNPGLGDPEVIIAAAGRTLKFDFAFVEPLLPSVNNDEFFASILDAATGLSVGPAFEFSATGSSSGTVSFDLTSLVGTTLGLSFQLIAGIGDVSLDSTVTVSNVRLEDPMRAIPEPTTLALLSLGLAGIGYGRHRSKRAA